MTMLFMDGFDHYATADGSKKWTSFSAAINASAGRRGGGCVEANAGDECAKTFTAATSFVIGFAFSVGSLLPGSTRVICKLTDAGTVQCSILLNSDGTLSVVRGTATAVTGGTSSFALSTNTFYYVEWKVTIADSIGANSCKVRINGADIITVATGQDLKSSANASANQVSLWHSSNTGADSTVRYYDDFYICDQSGSTNNDFLGDLRIDALYPNADGTYSQFTPSTGTDHFALVDETTPNTTDYNDGSTVGDRDSYALGNLAALTSQTVYAVQVNAAMNKDDAGAKSASTFVRSGGSNSDGASAALGTSQAYVSQMYETDPASAAWTESTVNGMEAGVRVTA